MKYEWLKQGRAPLSGRPHTSAELLEKNLDVQLTWVLTSEGEGHR